MTEIFANNAGGVLAADAASTDTSFTVEAGHTFPAPGAGDFFRATLWDVTGGEEVNHEIVKVTDVTNNVLTVERAQEGTSASAWSTGTEIELRFTAGALDGFIHRDPEHATDSGTDAYVSATNTTPPAAGVTITRDFQSANTTTTPMLDTLTITTRDGSALWAGALSGVHTLQLASGGGSWLVLDPLGTLNDRPLDDSDRASGGGTLPEWDTAGTDRKLSARGAAGPVIMTPDPLRMAVEAATGGRMTVLYDDAGLPNYMHVIPRFRYEDLGYGSEMGTGTATAFTVGGVDKAEILVGAYQASDDGNGNAVSIPDANPWVNIDYDASVAACTAKGAGWHLMTAHEWAAIALWCMANGFEPRGNTNHGRAHDATHEVGIRQDGATYPPGDSSGVGNILAGTGPSAWRHTNDPTGIADLVGNVWEWQHGLKLSDGEIFAIADNQYDQAEANWPTAGRFYQNDTGTPTLADTGTANQTYENVVWSNTGIDSGYTTSQLLKRLLIEPAGISPQGRLYVRDYGERLPRHGGNRDAGGSAGLAALVLTNGRGYSDSYTGFRPAFVT